MLVQSKQIDHDKVIFNNRDICHWRTRYLSLVLVKVGQQACILMSGVG